MLLRWGLRPAIPGFDFYFPGMRNSFFLPDALFPAACATLTLSGSDTQPRLSLLACMHRSSTTKRLLPWESQLSCVNGATKFARKHIYLRPAEAHVEGCKYHGVQKETVRRTIYNMSLDIYRNFAPLKQTTVTLAVACVELCTYFQAKTLQSLKLARLQGIPNQSIAQKSWVSTAAMLSSDRLTYHGHVHIDLFGLLDLWTHHRSATIVGRTHKLNTSIGIRIFLNLQSSAKQRLDRTRPGRLTEMALAMSLLRSIFTSQAPVRYHDEVQRDDQKDEAENKA